MIYLENISKHYSLGTHEVTALNDVCFSVKEGEYIALKGVSGSGKSTLLNILGFIDIPDSGKYFIDNEQIDWKKQRKTNLLRKKYFGFVFQNFNLIPELSVLQNIELPLLIDRVPANDRKKEVLEIIEQVGLKDHAKHKPDELSGGQQQRVAIARAMVRKPKYLLADEPTANLDSSTGKTILSLFQMLCKDFNVSIVCASHDNILDNLVSKIVYIKDGQINEAGL